MAKPIEYEIDLSTRIEPMPGYFVQLAAFVDVPRWRVVCETDAGFLWEFASPSNIDGESADMVDVRSDPDNKGFVLANDSASYRFRIDMLSGVATDNLYVRW